MRDESESEAQLYAVDDAPRDVAVDGRDEAGQGKKSYGPGNDETGALDLRPGQLLGIERKHVLSPEMLLGGCPSPPLRPPTWHAIRRPEAVAFRCCVRHTRKSNQRMFNRHTEILLFNLRG